MGFYDLNVPWSSEDADLASKLDFFEELGYNVIALSTTIAGKIPAEISCPIPVDDISKQTKKIRILRRCTIITSDPSQNFRLSNLAACYDIIAVRPTTEKAFQQAYSNPDHVSIISFDLTQRLSFHFRPKTVSAALAKGIRFEICYSPGILSKDNVARRNLIGNATQLIRASRGKGIIFSSEISSALGIRAPADVTNLATVWGLSQEQGRNAIHGEARSVVARADFLRSSYRGIIDIKDGGETAETTSTVNGAKEAESAVSQKRKAEDTVMTEDKPESPISKREQKRRAKRAKLEAAKQFESQAPPA